MLPPDPEGVHEAAGISWCSEQCCSMAARGAGAADASDCWISQEYPSRDSAGLLAAFRKDLNEAGFVEAQNTNPKG
jgi:hypothetical protein